MPLDVKVDLNLIELQLHAKYPSLVPVPKMSRTTVG